MRKICIINHKGGVGKTTTAINLGAGLTREGKKVLIMDLDAQGNIASSLNLETYKDMFDFLFENAELQECTAHVAKNLDVVRSQENLTKADHFLHKEQGSEYLLKNKLDGVNGYDYLILDCPPSLSLLNQNAMLYASEAIIPASTDFLGLEALRKMATAIKEINTVFDHNIRISKVVPTLFDARSRHCNAILSEMQNEFYEVMADPIRVNSTLKECPVAKQSIFSYNKHSRGAEDYTRLVKSVLRDEKKFNGRV